MRLEPHTSFCGTETTTMPGRTGLTVMWALPLAFVLPLFRMPAPRTRTFAPFTALPRFLTVATIVERLPTRSDFGPTVNVEQTGLGFLGGTSGVGTSVVADARLLAVLDSGSLPTTVTSFVTTPARVAFTTSVIVTEAPLGRVPRLHWIRPFEFVQVP